MSIPSNSLFAFSLALNCNPVTCDHQISGVITNTGHSVIFTADNETTISGYQNSGSNNGGSSSLHGGVQTIPQVPVNLTGGPLSYRYRFQEIHLHYGLHDQFGSEHSVEGHFFPAEVSVISRQIRFNVARSQCYLLCGFFVKWVRIKYDCNYVDM